jgi:hypothetical protein
MHKLIRASLLCLCASVPARAEPPGDADADRFTGSVRSGDARGRMVLELLSVDGSMVRALVSFSGGVGGRATLQGLVHRGAVHLTGLMVAGSERFTMALRAIPGDDGSLAGMYELSEEHTLTRQTGSFALVAADWRAGAKKGPDRSGPSSIWRSRVSCRRAARRPSRRSRSPASASPRH